MLSTKRIHWVKRHWRFGSQDHELYVNGASKPLAVLKNYLLSLKSDL